MKQNTAAKLVRGAIALAGAAITGFVMACVKPKTVEAEESLFADVAETVEVEESKEVTEE